MCSCGGELREFYTAVWFSVECAPSFVNKLTSRLGSEAERTCCILRQAVDVL